MSVIPRLTLVCIVTCMAAVFSFGGEPATPVKSATTKAGLKYQPVAKGTRWLVTSVRSD